MIDQRQVRYFEMQHRRLPEGRFFIPLADLYRRLGRHAEAASLLEAGLSRHPDSLSARVVLARVEEERGRRDTATALWEEILERDPGHAFAAAELARLQQPPASASPRTDKGTSVPPAETPAPEGEAPPQARDIPAAPDTSPPPAVETAAPVPAPTADTEAPAGGPAPVEPVEEEAAPAAPTPAADTAAATPLPEVFLTGTLADIYLRQGHRRKALAILRRLQERYPEREDVARRIAELEAESGEEGE